VNSDEGPNSSRSSSSLPVSSSWENSFAKSRTFYYQQACQVSIV
jgi:hypothetical protein